MSTDEFEIIIKKNGEIIVKFSDLEEQKVRHYREIFEEAIGPVRDVVGVGDESAPPGEVRYSDKDRKKKEQQDDERLKH